MPNGWKKGNLAEIHRLLASALGSGARRGVGDSPLVVQAGFPTSVADFVVKNRGRLTKKAPRWLQRRQSPRFVEEEAGFSTVASLASEIVAVEASVDSARPSSSTQRPEDAGRKQEVEEEEEEQQQQQEQRSAVATDVETRDTISEEGPVSLPGEEEETREAEGSASEASARPEPEKEAVQARNNRGFVMLARVAFLVFVLAIGTKKIAVGVSISAFAILILESIGRRFIPSPKPYGESKKKRLYTPAGADPVSSSNGRIPTKYLAAFCEKSLEIKAAVEDAVPLPALERKNNLEAEGSQRDQKGRNSNKKAKKLLRKLVPKKLRRGKEEKGSKVEAKATPASDCSTKGTPSQRGEAEEPIEEGEDVADDGNRDDEEGKEGGAVLGYVAAAGVKDAALLGEEVGATAKGRSGHLVFFLIVLSGLVGGRVAAMVLIVLWYSLVSSTRSLRKSWKMQEARKCVRHASIAEALSTGEGSSFGMNL